MRQLLACIVVLLVMGSGQTQEQVNTGSNSNNKTWEIENEMVLKLNNEEKRDSFPVGNVANVNNEVKLGFNFGNTKTGAASEKEMIRSPESGAPKLHLDPNTIQFVYVERTRPQPVGILAYIGVPILFFLSWRIRKAGGKWYSFPRVPSIPYQRYSRRLLIPVVFGGVIPFIIYGPFVFLRLIKFWECSEVVDVLISGVVVICGALAWIVDIRMMSYKEFADRMRPKGKPPSTDPLQPCWLPTEPQRYLYN